MEKPDIAILTHDGSTFDTHSQIIAYASPALAQSIQAAQKEGEEGGRQSTPLQLRLNASTFECSLFLKILYEGVASLSIPDIYSVAPLLKRIRAQRLHAECEQHLLRDAKRENFTGFRLVEEYKRAQQLGMFNLAHLYTTRLVNEFIQPESKVWDILSLEAEAEREAETGRETETEEEAETETEEEAEEKQEEKDTRHHLCEDVCFTLRNLIKNQLLRIEPVNDEQEWMNKYLYVSGILQETKFAPGPNEYLFPSSSCSSSSSSSCSAEWLFQQMTTHLPAARHFLLQKLQKRMTQPLWEEWFQTMQGHFVVIQD